MSVISLVTQKGGCGKTTLTTCLAVVAQQTGRQVVILDTDPQATASQWWESRDEKTPALLEVKGEEIARAVAVVQEKGFDLVINEISSQQAARYQNPKTWNPQNNSMWTS